MRIVESEAPITELDLDRAEQRMGVVLPDDLRDFLLRSNGGIPIPDCYRRGDEYYAVNCFVPLLGPDDGIEEALRVLRSDERSPPNVIPIADDPNGDIFVYSTDPATFGQIMFIQGDYFDDPDEFVVPLAPSLDFFLKSLVSHPDEPLHQS